MRQRIPEFILGVLATVAMFALGATIWPERPPSQSTSEQASQNRPDVKHPEPWLTKDAAGYFTFWLVVVGVVQLGLFYWQLRLIQAGAKDATNAAKAAADSARFIRNAERPYFNVFEIKLGGWKHAADHPDSLSILTADIEIENVGKGIGFFEGYSVCHAICSDLSKVSIKTNPMRTAGRLPISPDVRFLAGAPYDNFQLTRSEISDLISLRKTLYVYGYLEYSDLFKITRRTGFIFEFIASSVFPNQGTFGMVNHPLWRDGEISSGSQAG